MTLFLQLIKLKKTITMENQHLDVSRIEFMVSIL